MIQNPRYFPFLLFERGDIGALEHPVDPVQLGVVRYLSLGILPLEKVKAFSPSLKE
jgi:hypothetical protein